MAQREDVVVDGHVDAEEFQVGLHVSVETADLGSQVDNMSWSMLLKDLKMHEVNDHYGSVPEVKHRLLVDHTILWFNISRYGGGAYQNRPRP